MTQPYGLILVSQHLSADDKPLNLARALENLYHLCTSHPSGHWIFLGVPVTSEDLNRIRGALHGHVSCKAFGVSRLEAITLSGICLLGCLPSQKPSSLDFGRHICNHE